MTINKSIAISIISAVAIPLVPAIVYLANDMSVDKSSTPQEKHVPLGATVSKALATQEIPSLGYCITHASSVREGVYYSFKTDEPPPYYVGIFLPVYTSHGSASLRFAIKLVETYRKDGFISCKVYDLGCYLAVMSASYLEGLKRRYIYYQWGYDTIDEEELNEYREKIRFNNLPYAFGLGNDSRDMNKANSVLCEICGDDEWRGFARSNSLTNKFRVTIPLENGYEVVTNMYSRFPEMEYTPYIETNKLWSYESLILNLKASESQVAIGTGFRINIAISTNKLGRTSSVEVTARRAYSSFGDRSDVYYIRRGFIPLTVYDGKKITTDEQGLKFFTYEPNFKENIIHGTGL